jgi:hypothetical protein
LDDVIYVLVLGDHGHHLTSGLDKTCKDNDIIAVCVLAHSCHLSQSLNFGYFGPLKRAYGGLVEQKMRSGYNRISKFWLRAYPTARLDVFKPLNIQNGFAAAGIYSFKPQRGAYKVKCLCINYSFLFPPPPSPKTKNSPQPKIAVQIKSPIHDG